MFGVCRNIMLIFYRATIESVLRYSISSWFGNLTVKFKSQIMSLVKAAGKIMGMSIPLTPQKIFEDSTIRLADKILSDPAHVLNSEYELLRSGMRYRVPMCRLNKYKFSFVPLSIGLLNKRSSEGGQNRRR